MKRIGGIWATSLRILCVIALVSIGLAHKVPQRAESSPGVAIEASYVLPDGSMPDHCLSGGEDHHKSAPAKGCEACRLATNTLLPTPADMTGAPVSFRETPAPFIGANRTFQQRLLAHSLSARGPPAMTAA